MSSLRVENPFGGFMRRMGYDGERSRRMVAELKEDQRIEVEDVIVVGESAFVFTRDPFTEELLAIEEERLKERYGLKKVRVIYEGG